MADFLVLEDFGTPGLRLRAGSVISDGRYPQLLALQSAGLAVVPFVPGMESVVKAYEAHRASNQGSSEGDLVALLIAAGFIAGAGTGDVRGPAGAVDGNVALFDGASGKVIQDGGFAVDAAGTARPPTPHALGGAAHTGDVTSIGGDLAGAARPPTSHALGGAAHTGDVTSIGGDLAGAPRPPNGAAGGQLGGTYPGPDVRGIRETGGPTELAIGAIADGEVLVRAGGTITSQAPAAGGGGLTCVWTGGGFSTTPGDFFGIDFLGTTSALGGIGDSRALGVAPFDGTIRKLAWSSGGADATTVFAIWVDGVLVDTYTLTGLVGVVDVDVPHAEGESIGIEYDAGTAPGVTNVHLYSEADPP